jgi:hypothetical protein
MVRMRKTDPIAFKRNGRSSSDTSVSMVFVTTNELRTVNRLHDGGLLDIKGEGGRGTPQASNSTGSGLDWVLPD